MTHHGRIVLGTGCLAFLPWLGALGVERGAPETRLAAVHVETTPSLEPSGKAIFKGKGNCTACHGEEATGTPLGPNLTDGEWLHISGTVEEIATVVREGIAQPKRYPAPMPPMGGARLSPAEIDAVARYVFCLNPRDDGRR